MNAARVGGLAAPQLQRRISGGCPTGRSDSHGQPRRHGRLRDGYRRRHHGGHRGHRAERWRDHRRVSLAVDPTATQSRVTGTCGAGAAIASIAQAGSVSCRTLPTSLPPSGAAGGDLAGSTYPNPTIAASAVNSAKVSDNTLTGSDVNESTLAQVPSAVQLRQPRRATGERLRPGGESSPSARWELRVSRRSRTAGSTATQASPAASGYFKDSLGIGPSQGSVLRPFAPRAALGVVFTLPAGYRPARYLSHPDHARREAATSALNLGHDGSVTPDCGTTDVLLCRASTESSFRAGA